LLLYSSHLSLGVPNRLVIYHASSYFSGIVAGEQRRRRSHVNYTPALPFKKTFKTLLVLWHYFQLMGT
jgi:hypothetical protein